MNFRKKYYASKSKQSLEDSSKHKSDFETKDGKKYVRKSFMEKMLDKEIKEISLDINKAERRGAAAIKNAKIAAEATKPISKQVREEEFERQKVAKIQREKERKIVNQKAINYCKATLQVTDYDFEAAKQILAVKKIDLLENGINANLDILAINEAIDELDNVITQKHDEFSNNYNKKRK